MLTAATRGASVGLVRAVRPTSVSVSAICAADDGPFHRVTLTGLNAGRDPLKTLAANCDKVLTYIKENIPETAAYRTDCDLIYGNMAKAVAGGATADDLHKEFGSSVRGGDEHQWVIDMGDGDVPMS